LTSEGSARTEFLSALAVMERSDEPRDLIRLANRIADEEVATASELERILQSALPGDPIRTQLQLIVSRLDDVRTSAEWADGTSPRSHIRRSAVCRALGIAGGPEEVLGRLNPVLGMTGTTVIDNAEFARWYSRARATERQFYWRSYSEYLRSHRLWPEENIRALDLETDKVVERLADPLSDVPQPRRGLVMGYVQSGKTANYTGVIAKAIDVGYRLIIVLAGMQEPLRRQTQRRIDMELLGKANVLRDLDVLHTTKTAEGEYLDDPAWDSSFSELGGLLPSPEIRRLTSKSRDFDRRVQGELRFKPSQSAPPVYEAAQLYPEPARIAVVKKNTHVLEALLDAIRVNQRSMNEVPALIIDDESDQASVNTNTRDKARVEINRKICEILRRLPRSQYVGYTATPFANVFVDPEDEEDLFPRDFVISLAPPENYMGPSRFFDNQAAVLPGRLSNKDAYIRELDAGPRDEELQREELEQAVATFVAAGAVKLYRESVRPELGPGYRHHTMLVHESTKKIAHERRARTVREIWADADWEGVRGRRLLRAAFADLVTTMRARRKDGVPYVDDFDAVSPFVAEVIRRVESLGPTEPRRPENCVLIVNGDVDFQRRLDFDQRDEWKIVVGGALLSRGFTIEGLTVSYFRRTTRAQDTLQQMGRWFGYRPGYEDLVRIFLASNAGLGTRNTVSLYDAFVSNARNEEQFREQLTMYSGWDGDVPLLTPRNIRPLVWQSLPWLKPTAPQKMRNARLVRQRTPVFSPKGMGSIPDAVRRNWEVMLPILQKATQRVEIPAGGESARAVTTYAGVLSVGELADALRRTEWLDEDEFSDVIEPRLADYLQSERDGQLSDLLLLVPQGVVGRGEASTTDFPGIGALTTVTRARDMDGRFGEFTDPVHRKVADEFCEGEGRGWTALAEYHHEGRGAVIAYVIDDRPKEDDNSARYTIGLTVYLPPSASSLSDSGVLVFAAR
jgi:hypothetical protein